MKQDQILEYLKGNVKVDALGQCFLTKRENLTIKFMQLSSETCKCLFTQIPKENRI